MVGEMAVYAQARSVGMVRLWHMGGYGCVRYALPAWMLRAMEQVVESAGRRWSEMTLLQQIAKLS